MLKELGYWVLSKEFTFLYFFQLFSWKPLKLVIFLNKNKMRYVCYHSNSSESFRLLMIEISFLCEVILISPFWRGQNSLDSLTEIAKGKGEVGNLPYGLSDMSLHQSILADFSSIVVWMASILPQNLQLPQSLFQVRGDRSKCFNCDWYLSNSFYNFFQLLWQGFGICSVLCSRTVSGLCIYHFSVSCTIPSGSLSPLSRTCSCIHFLPVCSIRLCEIILHMSFSHQI